MAFSAMPSNISGHVKAREREHAEAEAIKEQVSRNNKRSIQDMGVKFSSIIDDVQVRLRAKTYGLVTLSEMKAAQVLTLILTLILTLMLTSIFTLFFTLILTLILTLRLALILTSCSP